MGHLFDIGFGDDDNLVIVRGDKRLAQIYAVHVSSPRAGTLSLSEWETGSKARDLAFWMLDPVG